MIQRGLRIVCAVLLAAVILIPAIVAAADKTPEQSWVLGRFTKNIKKPIALLNDYKDGCPDATRADCTTLTLDKTYLDHQLLLGEKKGDYRFVHLFSARGSAYGWLAEKYVRVVKTKKPKASHWTGTWVTGKPQSNKNIEVTGATETFLPDSIRITKLDAETLRADGNAFWYGPMVTHEGSDERVVHFGAFNADAKPTGTRILFAEKESGCEVSLQQISPDMLFAADNGNCGGMNVHFSGVFLRDDTYKHTTARSEMKE